MNSAPRTIILFILFLALGFGAVTALGAEDKFSRSPWENSIVTIEVARKQYDYYQPWSQRNRRLQKTGTVVGDRQILTTADELQDRTFVRLQKFGRGQWAVAEVVWVDYYANLALLTTTETNFWKDLKPARLGGPMPHDGNLQIIHWREGNLEIRRAEFTQFTVRESQSSSIDHVIIETSCDIQGAGWGELLVSDSHVVGLVRSQDGKTCTAIPTSFIKSLVAAHEKKQYPGLGYFHFFWQPAENPVSLARLKLPGEPRGVIVIDVPPRPDAAPEVIKTEDVLLKIDGFELDTSGDYDDPEFGNVLLENLATRKKWAGDDVKIRLWRDGKEMDVTYRLPRFDYTNSLVPYAKPDLEPEYLIVGGLVFQPLTVSYLQSWGADWKRRAPFRLVYYTNESPTKEQPELLLLSQVLPDPYNIGYQETRMLVVEKVNGLPVTRLKDLRDALQKPKEGYHVFEFDQGDTLRRLVLAAGNAEEEATARVLKRYAIPERFRLAGGSTEN